MMKYLYALFVLLLSVCNASAQETFTGHLSQRVAGQGTVNVQQDQKLADIVNGVTPITTTAPASSTTTTQSASSASERSRSVSTEDEVVTEETVRTMHVKERMKARGYRIQVFWGGNKSIDKSKAQNAGLKVTSAFPELQAYTSYESPHWRCRVGDFVSREEAAAYVRKISKEANIDKPLVVKSEVWIWQ